MQYNKNPLCYVFLPSFTKSRYEKILKEHSLWEQLLKKGEKLQVLGILYRNVYHIYQKKIPSKIYIYIKYICLTIKIWLKICKIMAFKNWQQESAKGTLRLENKLFSFNFKLILKFAPLLLFIAHLLKQLKILIHFLII